ncbi:MAG: carboxymuconolactone decarboxylase family protein [Telluria sp.]
MQRLDFTTASPQAYRAWLALETYIAGCGLEKSLLHLVKLRVSQINGCAYCIDMHAREARRDGDSERRLYALAAWREAPFFTPRERAALGWAEALTRLSQDQHVEPAYAPLREHFSDKELTDLTVAIMTINGWNRLSVGFGAQPAG